MLEITDLTTFLGWCSLFNLIYLCLATVLLITMKGFIVRIHAKMFGLAEDDLSRIYMKFLANYKIAFLILTLFPYLALKTMGH